MVKSTAARHPNNEAQLVSEECVTVLNGTPLSGWNIFALIISNLDTRCLIWMTIFIWDFEC